MPILLDFQPDPSLGPPVDLRYEGLFAVVGRDRQHLNVSVQD